MHVCVLKFIPITRQVILPTLFGEHCHSGRWCTMKRHDSKGKKTSGGDCNKRHPILEVGNQQCSFGNGQRKWGLEQNSESKNEEKKKYSRDIENRKLAGPTDLGVREKKKIKYGSKFSSIKDHINSESNTGKSICNWLCVNTATFKTFKSFTSSLLF